MGSVFGSEGGAGRLMVVVVEGGNGEDGERWMNVWNWNGDGLREKCNNLLKL